MDALPNLEMIQRIDAMIRDGQVAAAREIVSQIEIKKTPREFAARLAALARRLELFSLALRLLNPIVRDPNPHASPPTQEEQLEYGVVLIKVGALLEGRRMLEGVEARRFPDALLFLAMSHFSEWNYAAALPLLRSYVKAETLTDYKRVVGEVNLAASLIREVEFDEARELLAKLRRLTKESSYQLLHGNCLELSALLSLALRSYKEAGEYLHQALGLLKGSNSVSELYIRKWLAISESYLQGTPTPELNRVRTEATKANQWEVSRDCDFHEGLITRDRRLLQHCYFGTPFPAYRAKLLQESPIELELPETYELKAIETPSVGWIDLELGSTSDSAESLKTGSHLHRFLILVARDFYKPIDVVTAFGQVSPDEYYNPESSPQRIHQLANRLRSWFSETGLPVSLQAVEGRYRLSLDGPISIRVPRDLSPLDADELILLKMKRVLSPDGFTAAQARETLDVSFGSMNKILNWALTNERLVKIGNGPQTRYVWPSPKP